LLRGLRNASRRCDLVEGRKELVKLLERPEWLGTPAAILRSSLLGPFERGDGRAVPSSLFNHFYEADCNVPSLSAARSVFNAMKTSGMIPNPEEAARELPFLFREDLYREVFASRTRSSSVIGKTTERPSGVALTSN